MRGFASRTTVEQAWEWLAQVVRPLADVEVPLAQAAGRVLARAISSPVAVPGFARGMMDGFALRAADTHDATNESPRLFVIAGESLPGKHYANQLTSREAVRIMTGAPLPDGADAVVPVELVTIRDGSVEVRMSVSPGKHVAQPGEEIRPGDAVFSAGRRLRPQDLGLLSSLGSATVPVLRRPRVRLVITGNELLPAGSRPEAYRIPDANGPLLSALVERDGGEPLFSGLTPDDPAEILTAFRDPDADVILVSGGSSVGQEDYAPVLLRKHGELAIHGLAMRPSGPAGMGRIDHRLVFLLPGNPVSCLCAYDFFAGRAIRGLGGRIQEWPYRKCRSRLIQELSSPSGRVDYVRVTGNRESVEPLPQSGSALSSTTQALGFLVVPADCEGFSAGAEVDVWLYDDP